MSRHCWRTRWTASCCVPPVRWSDASFVEAVSSHGTARVDARGQRLAILPIAIVANRLLSGLTLEGAMPPSRAIGGEELLDALRSAGCDVARTAS